jgi:hypothetical protein
MPAYRAERTLAKTVADIPPSIADLLILVDDASPDNTVALARDLGIDVYVHSANRGYGGNQKTCYTEAVRNGADVVVLLHPDYQYEPQAVPLLIAPLLAGYADMTFGSRFAGLGDPMSGGMPLYRFVGNRVTTLLENLMLGSRFSEMHSGLRAYTRRCLLSLPYLRYSDDFVFDSQLLVDAVTSGQRVVEVPIPTRYTKESSSIAVGRSLRYIGGSLRYCAHSALVRGRRGRRSPVAHPGRALQAAAGAGGRIHGACPVCGGDERVALGTEAVVCARCGFSVPARGTGGADAALSAAASSDPGRTAQHILDVVGGYVVRGDDLLAVSDDGGVLERSASDCGWTVSTALPGALPVPRTAQGATERRGRQALGLGRGRFDAVVLVDALGSAPVDELRRVRALLDPTGILALAVSHAGSAGPRGRPAATPPAGGPVFTAASVWTALGRAGFRLVEWVTPRRGSLAAATLGMLGVEHRLATPDAQARALAVARVSEQGPIAQPDDVHAAP